MSKSSLIYAALSAMCLVGGAVAAFEAGQAASTASQSSPSPLSVVSPIHDFGRVRQGEPLEATFLLRNESSDTLRIMGTPTDCGCTVAEMDSPVIEPGAEAKLRVEFKTGTGRGQVGRRIAVRYVVEGG